MTIWLKMEKEVKDYREALAEDSTFHQDEADEELWHSLVRKLNEESFTIIKDVDQSPYDGINGKGKDIPLSTVWDILRRTPYVNGLSIQYQDKTIPVPNNPLSYERFGDLARHVARELNIPYQV